MASGPWDNVQLQGPPNGPAWAQAAAQLMGATGNAVNGAFNAYNNQQQFGYQQRQQNFFQNPQNQQLLTNFIQQPTQQNYAALMQPMIQAGGMQAAGPMIDQLIGMKQDENIAKLIGGGGGQPEPVNSGPASHSSAAGPGNITGNFGGAGSQLRVPYGVEGSNAPNVNTIVGKTGANIPDQVAQRFATSVGASSPEDDLTPDQAARVQQRLSAYLKRTGSAGGANPVPQSGSGDQEAAGSNELRPSMGEGSSAVSPRQTGERNIQTAQNAPTNFNDRFGASGDRTGERTSPLGDKAKLDAMDARLAQLRAYEAAYARRSPAASQAAGKAADDLKKQRDALAESLSKYNEPGTNPVVKQQLEAGGALGTALGKRQGEVVEAGGLAARHTIGTIEIMQDAFRRSAGKLPEGPFAENTLKFKQAVNNYIPGLFDQGEIIDATAITKLNSQLAAEAAKAMTARPSQLEFRAFMANNPGLSTGVDGGLFLSEVIKRAKQQDIKLSSLAAKTSPDQWPSVEEKFFADPKNSLFTDAERKNPYLVIGQRGPSQPAATQPASPGGWQEIAPGIRIREKPNAANKT